MVSNGSRRPLLLLVTGLQGTGKSTIADAAALRLGAPVLAHDWAMSGLRPFPEIQLALDEMEPSGHKAVGWSILFALGRAQLRRNAPVVLDGVARNEQVRACRRVAEEENARCLVIVTECPDFDILRSRIEGRQRAIPNWYELDWPHVEGAIASWEPIEEPNLVLDTSSPLSTTFDLLDTFLKRRSTD